MKKNIMKPILCFLVVSAFLMPLMGTTALAETQETYFFNSRDTTSDPPLEWETNPGNLINGDPGTYASTTINGDVQWLIGNTCGTGPTVVTKVELKTRGYYDRYEAARDIILRIHGSEYSYIFDNTSSTAQWSEWFDITNDLKTFLGTPTLTLTDVHNLDCDVEASSGAGTFELYCSIVKIRVTTC